MKEQLSKPQHTYFGLQAAQNLATLRDQERAQRAAEKLLPLMNLIDRDLIWANVIPAPTRQYLFRRMVLVRR